MLHRRVYQFLIIYFLGLGALMLVKYSLNLSDYTIPGVAEIWTACRRYFGLYLLGDGLSSPLLIAAMICYFPLLLSIIGILSEPVKEIEHFFESTLRMNWRLQVKIRAFENSHKLITVVVGSATLAMVGTIVAEFIAANAGIGYSIRIALYQSDLAKIFVALFLIGICTSLYLVLLEWIGSSIKKRFGSV